MHSIEPEHIRAERLATAAARRAELDPRGLKVLRCASATIVELPRAGVIARVERAASERCAERLVRSALHFERCGAPVVRLVRPELQPIRSPDGFVTLWTKLEPTAETLSDVALGELLGRLHACAKDPPDDLPRLTPHATLSDWLDTPDAGISEAEVATVRARMSATISRDELAALDDPLGRVLLHGDVHGDNVILTVDGPRLIDLELAGVGPASWDLVPMGLAVRRYGMAEERFAALVRGYGADPRGWSGFRELVDLYELQVVSWSIMTSGRSTEMAEEAQRRVDTYLGRAEHRWMLL